jgi:hypothetical protein
VHNAAQYGCPCIISGNLKDRVDAYIRENMREIHEVFQYVSRSILYDIVTVLG